ncbi:PAS domain S-box protein [Pseudodesulfovibrio cashew]|uniref:histidine kinase n=1 Tax=Pseudodesulfovibrio cashew TaxID=2678688 RepID=A0A6I6JEF7_9BACT|nr:PAS domain-containing sensor histidine kinase [Pseudodesulfovibrio cashew]QGY39013.1 PAS domain S-box protein [Pseudodesulfovibrio cashew]
MIFGIVLASTLLQFAAGLFALRLVASSGRSLAWALLSSGIFIMAFRRTHTLFQLFQGDPGPPFSYEVLGLAISVLVFAGIALIDPLLRELRTSAQKLAESEERYRTVASFTHDWEYWLSPNGHYRYISPACERITGYTPDDFTAEPLLLHRIIHPDDRERVLAKLSSLAALGEPLHFDFRLIRKDGTARWVAHASIPVTSPEGAMLGIRASVRDIDQRKRLEAEIRENRALYRGLVENSRTLVLLFDASGKATYANAYALRRLGYGEEELREKTVRDILLHSAAQLPEDGEKKIEAFLNSGQRLELEIETRRPDGTTFWGEWAGSFIGNVERKIGQYICVGIDVSRRKALDKLKEEVTRIVRHDLKSPLSGIIGIPRVLRRDDNLTPRQQDLLQSVEEAGTVMLDLINQSLALYKLETGTYEFDMREVDIAKLVREVLRHLQIGREKAVPVHFNLNGTPADEEACAMIRAEYPLLFSLLCNLMKNALEANEGHPVSIDVDVEETNGCVIRIANAGVVPESIRERFFDKYVTAGKPGGTGLGTYSARLITRRHGGDISMHSAPGQGTTVTVTLPAPEEEP